ncbi:MAG: hypothetical protein JST85_28680 [Acidobacteria bacterium]|nr:hypothetical protein [Acidobacteriota bacterium]
MKMLRKILSITSVLCFCILLCSPSTASAEKNNKLHGGIEIGSRGVKGTAIHFTRKGNGYEVKVLYTETINTSIMKVKDNRFTPEGLKEAADAVKKMFDRLQQEYQVPVEQIYIVGSSGLRADNKPELVSAINQAIGRPMSFLTVDLEVQLSIAGTIPRKRDDEAKPLNEREVALLLDIGSGNTKGGYQQPDSPKEEFVTMGIPFGTVSFTNEVNKLRKVESDLNGFAVDAMVISPKVLNEQIRKEIEKKPGLLYRKRVYLSGGIIWAMATLMHPENRRAFVTLTTDEIAMFHYRARNDMDRLLNPDLSRVDDQKRAEVKKEIEAVKATFTPKNILAGAEILNAVSTEFKLETKDVWFARYGNLSWILSYVRGQAEKALLAAEGSTTSDLK